MNFSVIVPSYKDVGIEKLIHNILESKTGEFELDIVACGYDKLPDFGNKVMVIKEKAWEGVCNKSWDERGKIRYHHYQWRLVIKRKFNLKNTQNLSIILKSVWLVADLFL